MSLCFCFYVLSPVEPIHTSHHFNPSHPSRCPFRFSLFLADPSSASLRPSLGPRLPGRQGLATLSQPNLRSRQDVSLPVGSVSIHTPSLSLAFTTSFLRAGLTRLPFSPSSPLRFRQESNLFQLSGTTSYNSYAHQRFVPRPSFAHFYLDLTLSSTVRLTRFSSPPSFFLRTSTGFDKVYPEPRPSACTSLSPSSSFLEPRDELLNEHGGLT